MAEISPVRKQIQQEDTAYRRSVSETILTKIGAETNFINTYQTDIKEFKLNGSFSIASNLAEYDGLATFFYASEIVGVAFSQADGATGTTSFDVRWRDTNDTDQGSIFSTQAQINQSGAKRGFKSLETGTEIEPSGVTLPVFNRTKFYEGEALYLYLTSVMTEAFNGTLTIFYRPINTSDVDADRS